MFTRLVSVAAWGGFFYLAVVHNTNWLFWLCSAIVWIDRWIIIPFILRVMGSALVKLAKQEVAND